MSRAETVRELPEAIYDAEVVQYRLEDAGAVLLALPGRGCFPAGYRTAWPQDLVRIADESPFRDEDLPIPPPSAKRIGQMDEAFAWLQLMPADKAEHRRIVLLRSLTSPRHGRHLYSWREIGRRLGLHRDTVQARYAEGIGWITTELYRQQLGGAQWAYDWQRVRQVAGSLNTKTLVPDAPPPGAPPSAAEIPETTVRHLEAPSVAQRAASTARYVQLMSGRSRAALTHFPLDGAARSIRGGRGFGEREVIVLEMAGFLGRGEAEGEFMLTGVGRQARGMLPGQGQAVAA